MDRIRQNKEVQNVYDSCGVDAAIFCGSASVHEPAIPFLDPISFPTRPFYGGMDSYFDTMFSPLPTTIISVSTMDGGPKTVNEIVVITDILDDIMGMSLGIVGMPILSVISFPNEQPLAFADTAEASEDVSPSEVWDVVQNVFDEMVVSLIDRVETNSANTENGDSNGARMPSPERLSKMIDGFANKLLSDSSVEAPRKMLARRLTGIESSPTRRRLQSMPSSDVSKFPSLGYGFNSDTCLYNLWLSTQPSVLSLSCATAIDNIVSHAGLTLIERREQQYKDYSEEYTVSYNGVFFLSCLIVMFAFVYVTDSPDEEVMPKEERRALKRKILCAVYGNDGLKSHVESIIHEKIDDVPILRGKLTREKIVLKRKILVAICRNSKLRNEVQSVVGEDIDVFFDFLKERIIRHKTQTSLMHRFCQKLPYISLVVILSLTAVVDPPLVLMVCGPALVATALYSCLSGLFRSEDVRMEYPGSAANREYDFQTQGGVDGSAPQVFVGVPLLEPLLVV